MADVVNLDSVVKDLVQEHFRLEPDLKLVVWLRKGPKDEIRLLEVNDHTPATGSVDVFYFSPSKDTPYPVRIAEVTLEEWARVKSGEIALPETWTLEKAKYFESQGSAV